MNIADTIAVQAPGYRSIPVDTICVVSNVRKTYDREKQAELEQSIKAIGLLEPLFVKAAQSPRDNTADYELLCGHRRLAAVKSLGWTEVPCVVQFLGPGAPSARVLQIAENAQRADVHPLEEAEAYQALSEEEGMSLEEISRLTGKSKALVSRRIKLNSLTADVAAALQAGKVSLGEAEKISALTVAGQKRMIKELKKREPEDGFVAKLDSQFLSLTDAPFDPDIDVKGIGTCTACAKRQQGILMFSDSGTGDGKCPDAKCFRKRADLEWEAIVVDAVKKGHVVLAPPRSRQCCEPGSGYLSLSAKNSVGETWQETLQSAGVLETLRRQQNCYVARQPGTLRVHYLYEAPAIRETLMAAEPPRTEIVEANPELDQQPRTFLSASPSDTAAQPAPSTSAAREGYELGRDMSAAELVTAIRAIVGDDIIAACQGGPEPTDCGIVAGMLATLCPSFLTAARGLQCRDEAVRMSAAATPPRRKMPAKKNAKNGKSAR